MSGFYVMEQCDGDECLLFQTETYEEACEKVEQEAFESPGAVLSVWESGGMILLMYDATHGYVLTRRAVTLGLKVPT